MLNAQTIIGLYRESTLGLMVSFPPLPDFDMAGLLAEAFSKYFLFQKRNYINSRSFLVKCFQNNQHNFTIICLTSDHNSQRTAKIFHSVIDKCSKAEGRPTLTLYNQLLYFISFRNLKHLFYFYDFENTKSQKKAKEQEDAKEDQMQLDFQLNDVVVDGTQSVFGFLQKSEPPMKSGKVPGEYTKGPRTPFCSVCVFLTQNTYF